MDKRLVIQVLERQLEVLEKRKETKTDPADKKRIDKHINDIKSRIKELA